MSLYGYESVRMIGYVRLCIVGLSIISILIASTYIPLVYDRQVAITGSDHARNYLRRWSVERLTHNSVDDLLLYSWQYISRPVREQGVVWYNVEYDYGSGVVFPKTVNYYYNGYVVSFSSSRYNSTSIDYGLGGRTLILYTLPERTGLEETLFYNGLTSTLTIAGIPITIPQTIRFSQWFKPTCVDGYRVVGLGGVDENGDRVYDGEEVFLFTWYPGSIPGYRRLTYSIVCDYGDCWDSVYEVNPQIDGEDIAWTVWSDSLCDLYVNGGRTYSPSTNCSFLELLFFENGKAVYYDDKHLYLYNGERHIVLDEYDKWWIGGDRRSFHNGSLAWFHNSGEDTIIEFYDGERIVDLGSGSSPIVYGKRVLWTTREDNYIVLKLYSNGAIRDLEKVETNTYDYVGLFYDMYGDIIVYSISLSKRHSYTIQYILYDLGANIRVNLTDPIEIYSASRIAQAGLGIPFGAIFVTDKYVVWSMPVDDDRDWDCSDDDFEVFIAKPIYGFITDGHGHGVGNVEVVVNWKGREYRLYSDSDGYIFFNIDDPDFYIGSSVRGELTVILRDRWGYIEVYDWSSDRTNPTNFTIDFRLDRTPIIIDPSTSHIVSTNTHDQSRLDDLIAIYYYTEEAVLYAVDKLGLRMDYGLPVEIRAFSPTHGTFYSSSFINIDERDSLYTSINRPDNREWHEFGHHVMADSLIGGDNRFPSTVIDWWFLWDSNDDGVFNLTTENYTSNRDINHWGYMNPSTTDSWIEGFAEFYSLLVSSVYGEDSRPELYIRVNLEEPHRAWGLYEEFAVASLLWDLVDSGSDTYVEWVYRNNSLVDVVIGDHICIPVKTLWNMFIASNITTVKDLYDMLTPYNVDSDGNGFGDVNELFILHGFFRDTKHFQVYDIGEEVGVSGHNYSIRRYMRLGSVERLAEVSARVDRYSPPPVPNGSIIYTRAFDRETDLELDNYVLLIEIVYNEPYGFLNYNYTLYIEHSGEPAPIYLPELPSKAYIYVVKEGYYRSEPLIINNSFYWNRVLNGSSYLLNHSFTLEPKPTYNLSLSQSFIECIKGGSYSIDLLVDSLRSYNYSVYIDLIKPQYIEAWLSREEVKPSETIKIEITIPEDTPSGNYTLYITSFGEDGETQTIELEILVKENITTTTSVTKTTTTTTPIETPLTETPTTQPTTSIPTNTTKPKTQTTPIYYNITSTIVLIAVAALIVILVVIVKVKRAKQR